MRSLSIVALSGLVSFAVAVPLLRRDIVWVTQTEVDIVTIPVTTTVWVDASDVPSAANVYYRPRPTSVYERPSTYDAPAAPASPTDSSSDVLSTAAAQAAQAAPAEPNTPQIYSAPAPTTSVYVAPTAAPPAPPAYAAPTTSAAPVPATTAQAVASPPAAPPSYGNSAASGSTSGPGWFCPDNFGSAPSVSGAAAPGSSFTGDMTWFQDGMGACGCTNAASDHIVAVSQSLFDLYTPGGNPNKNPLCGKTVTISGAGGSYTATVVDRCVGCKPGDLDLSQDFFNKVTNYGNGRVPGVSWKFD